MSTLLAAAIGLYAPQVPQHCLRPQMDKATFVQTVHEDDDAEKLWGLKLHLRTQTCGYDLNLGHFNPEWDTPYEGGKLGTVDAPTDYENDDWTNYETATVASYGDPIRGRLGDYGGSVVRGSVGRPVFASPVPFGGGGSSAVFEVKEIIYTNIAPIPLPASFWLLAAALAGLAGTRLRT